MQQYPNFLQIQKQNELRKLQEAQNQLARLEAQEQQGYMPMGFQYQAQTNRFPCKVVNDFNEVTAQDVPMDNLGACFIKSDDSEIEIRKWDKDGKIIFSRFKQVLDTEPNNSTLQNVDSLNEPNFLTTEVFENNLQSINDRLDKIEKILQPKKTLKKSEDKE